MLISANQDVPTHLTTATNISLVSISRANTEDSLKVCLRFYAGFELISSAILFAKWDESKRVKKYFDNSLLLALLK